jgi:ubiquinone biosynthesis protein
VTPLALFGWIVFGIPSMVGVTFVASRLLGAKRGWWSLLFAGLAGWAFGVLIAGQITQWRWASFDMVIVSLIVGTLSTMVVALAIDLIRPEGSLLSGDEAGLISLRNPLDGIRLRRARAARYREILHLARVNGVIGSRSESDLPSAVRATLEQAGGIFVKLGQVASTRTDALSDEWCSELAKLQSHAEPAPRDLVEPLIEAELGRPVSEAFASFDWEPIASASIAQIYGAELLDGTSVVVKVQRPGLGELMATDRSAILTIAELLEHRTTLGLNARPLDLAREFLDNVAEELDFEIEAGNAVDLASGLASIDGIRVAEVITEMSTHRILVEERVEGVSIAEFDAEDSTALAQRLIESFMFQIFDVGIFHADPHPGNILVQPGGEIVLIDLGAVGRMSSSQRSATTDLLLAASLADATALRQALSRIVVFDDRADLHALDRALDRFLARNFRPNGGISARAFEDLTSVIAQFGIHFPDWLATLVRTMVTLEGTLTTIDPDFSLVDAAQAYAAGESPLGNGSLSDTIKTMAMKEVPRLRRIPERVDSILGQAAEGRLTARISMFGDERNEQVITKLVNRVVMALIASSLGVGSVLLIGTHAGPHLGSSLSILSVLGYVGLASASILAMRVIASVVRDGPT